MSDRKARLLIDIGNSRIKYARVVDNSSDIVVEYAKSAKQLTTIIEQSVAVFLASVGHKHKVEKLRRLCKKAGVPLNQVKTEAEKYGVRCAYKKYKTMGVDRWLAILAARKMTSLPFAVMDFGTAATCDFVVENEHLGGWILPGFQLMRSAVINNTVQVFGDNFNPQDLSVGTSTEQCVNQGCQAALQGVVAQAETFLAAIAPKYRIFLCGGDNKLIDCSQIRHLTLVDNMVLKGLARYL